MKKITLFLALLLLPMQTLAATVASSFNNTLILSETKELAPITVVATAEGEIKAANGINFVLDIEKKILWDNLASVNVSGTAVTNGKIAPTVSVEYKNDYLVAHVPVLQDFAKDEYATFSFFKLRAYNNSFKETYFGVDLTGDNIPEVYDSTRTEVVATQGADNTPPYQPSEFKAVSNSTFDKVTLSWKNPPDFDLIGATIERKRERNGQTSFKVLAEKWPQTTFEDTDVQKGDKLTYTFYQADFRNFTQPLMAEITLQSAEPTSTPTPTPTPSTELDTLNRLYGSYKLRYSIKCFPSGVARPEGDAACLWAKIDLLYTQAKTGQSDVTAAFTAREKDLIALRLPFSQNRYQTQCIEAVEPASYCTALGKALDRAEYFLGE